MTFFLFKITCLEMDSRLGRWSRIGDSQLWDRKIQRSRSMFGPKTEVQNSCFKFKCCDLCLNESKDDENKKREINHPKEERVMEGEPRNVGNKRKTRIRGSELV